VAVDPDDVRAAAARLDGVANRTPVLTSRTLDERLGASLFLKAENFQRVGAFKFRGAYNAVSQLPPGTPVATASSGNHAQAVSLAARLLGTTATILMPEDAPPSKRAATEGYGAEVIEFDRYTADREALLEQLAAERGLHMVHAYDDERVIAGQGTVGLELAADVPDLDAVVIPVGGGGLISGCATALPAGVRIVGVEPEASDDVARSMAAGERVTVEVGRTIADGQQLPTPGRLTWPIIERRVDEVVTVSDPEVVTALRFLLERMKVLAEPSGATALAALLAGKAKARGRVGVVLSGGNVDPARLASLLS
jgi:threo-3-hydroxy-L-aspartate ammonia-lyase